MSKLLSALTVLAVVWASVSLMACQPSVSPTPPPDVTPQVHIISATGRTRPERDGIVVSTLFRVDHDLLLERQIVAVIAGERFLLSNRDGHLAPQMGLDAAFLCDFDSELYADCPCRQHLREVFVKVVGAFHLDTIPAMDRARFIGADCTDDGRWKRNPHRLLNELWECTEKASRRDSPKDLARQVYNLASQLPSSTHTEQPLVVILRWQPEPIEIQRGDELYHALQDARKADIPVLLISMGEGATLPAQTATLLRSLGIKHYQLQLPGACPTSEIEWGEGIQDQLSRFREDIAGLRTIYLYEYNLNKVFTSNSPSVEIGLTKPMSENDDIRSFDRKVVSFELEEDRIARPLGIIVALIALVGLPLSFPLFLLALAASEFRR
jgi:hypothetical protein